MNRLSKLFLVAVALVGVGMVGSKSAEAGYGCYPPPCGPYGCHRPCYAPYFPPYCPPYGCHRHCGYGW